MLKQIRIQNLALIQEAEIGFGPGFCAVTGETGAGKSVFLTPSSSARADVPPPR